MPLPAAATPFAYFPPPKPFGNLLVVPQSIPPALLEIVLPAPAIDTELLALTPHPELLLIVF
jgi:hypothetical protein